MSAKADFRKAQLLVHRAEKLTSRHLDRLEYPDPFAHFDTLIRTLNRLAILGVTVPPTKPP